MQILFQILLFVFILFFVFGGSIGGVWYYLHTRRLKKREERSLAAVLLQVKVPKSNEIKIDAMEQVISSLHAIAESGGFMKRFDDQPTISFEIVAEHEDIKFYIWASKGLRDLVEKQVHGGYPDAELLEVDEYNIFSESGHVAHKSYQLSKDIFYPIKTYKELPTDPLAAITSAIGKMGQGEAAAIQILISPVNNSWQKSGRAYITNTKKQEADPEKVSHSVSAKSLEAIENKVSKLGYEASIRAVVVSDSLDAAGQHLSNIDTALTQFTGEFNSLKSRKTRNKGAMIEDFIYRYQPIFHFWGNKASIFNAEELATIFHLPNKAIVTPHIDWLGSKSAPAPAHTPTEGLYLGVSRYRGTEKKIFVGTEDRMRHMYLLGKTGTGKTQFMMSMIRQDMKAGHGLCFIDPHGDAVEDLLEHIPPERAEDVIYFRPSDVERPMGLNLLEAKTEDQKHFVTGAIINLMYKMFDPYKTGIVGPRFEHTVRNALLTVMSEEGASFVELMRVLTDNNYVKELIPKIQDPVVRRFWTDQMAQTAEFHKSETLDYITSKFGRFVTNRMVRNMIGQSKSAFNFREVMDTGKILLVNLSKGELGEENSNFLGLILVPRILMAAMSRTDIHEKDRRDFYLYVDEFQNFATPDFAVILSEARKYRLGLVVANQFIGQIDDDIKGAIFGNAGTVMAYRVGNDDAPYLAQVFDPYFGQDDFLNLEKHHVYVKTIVQNEQVTPFSMKITLEDSFENIKAKANPKMAEIVTEMSRLKYGRDAKLVEAEIVRRARL
jgi:hypothetical protein